MFDGSQLQWCPSLCDIIFYLEKLIVCNFSPRSSTEITDNAQQTRILESPAAENKKTVSTIELNFTGLNLFALNAFNNGIAIRTDALTISSTADKGKISVEGLKLMPLSSMMQVSM